MMNLKQIREGEYEELYSHMKRDFPSPGELAPFHSITRNLENNIYDGFIITKNSADIGYALITAPENLRFALITYFAIYPERILVIEVNDPSAAKTDTLKDEALRRVKFYERAGFSVLPTERAKIYGLDMLIMASSSDNTLNAREIMHALYMPSFDSPERLKNIDVL